MRAAEKLIANRGIENVSVRDIVTAAKQKNESALQYHFGNLQGLVRAIHREREGEVQAKRSELLERMGATTAAASLREICKVMVSPTFQLARSRPDFRRYVKAFGHEIILTQKSAVDLVSRQGGISGAETGTLLRGVLKHLDDAAYLRRLDGALRFISASMFHQARQQNAFRGVGGDLFFSSLIDALVGLLSAPESDETRTLSRRSRMRTRSKTHG